MHGYVRIPTDSSSRSSFPTIGIFLLPPARGPHGVFPRFGLPANFPEGFCQNAEVAENCPVHLHPVPSSDGTGLVAGTHWVLPALIQSHMENEVYGTEVFADGFSRAEDADAADQKDPPVNERSPVRALPLAWLLAVTLTLGLPRGAAGQAQVRLKDIARVAGSREYQIIGYGLVTGLDGTGDKTPMSLEMVRGMLQNMGMDLDKTAVQSKNCAAVVVTAMIPPYGKAGESFDVVVSSIGDCKSLQGGVLLPTLLKGGDGQIYAVAQGNVSIGGIQAGNGAAGAAGAAAQKHHLTVGRIPNGAIQEREVGDSFGRGGSFHLILQRKDAALSRRVKEAIERKFGEGWARLVNPGTVEVKIPQSFRDDPVSFAATIEELPLSIDEPNRVVINERTGTIIVGNRVRIGRIVISQGALRLEVDGQKAAGRAGAGTTGTAGAGGARGQDSPKGSLIAIKGETTVDDLVSALNAVGATPKDIIAIFQAIEAAGALHGELRFM